MPNSSKASLKKDLTNTINRLTGRWRRFAICLTAWIGGLHANLAQADWGDNWGEFDWGLLSTPVPTLGGWGALLLVTALLTFAVRVISKRRGTSATLVTFVAVLVPLAGLATTIGMPNTFSNGTTADADEVNANFDVLVNESNTQDTRITDLESGPPVHTHPGSEVTSQVADADTVDGVHASELEESAEIDADILLHAAQADAAYVDTAGDTMTGDLRLPGLLDPDGSNFFDGGCPDNTHLSSIGDDGALSCVANSADITGVTAGAGLIGGGTSGSPILSHADTSAATSVNNSGGVVIQDITLDTYGHISAMASSNLDNRYYTEPETDLAFVDVSGDTMTGVLSNTTDVRAARFVDFSDSSFYTDPAGVSQLNDVRANIFYDRQNLTYYLNPASTSNLNSVIATTLTALSDIACTNCIDANDVDTSEVRIDWSTQAAHPACSSYTLDTDMTRETTYYDGVNECDSAIGTVWTRFTDGANHNRMLPTRMPARYACDTHAPGYLVGEHPAVEDGEVTRKVCFHWNTNSCNWNSDIQVVNCGEYYVYELVNTPSCNLRYCTDPVHSYTNQPILAKYYPTASDVGVGNWDWDATALETSFGHFNKGADSVTVSIGGFYEVCHSLMYSSLVAGDSVRTHVQVNGTLLHDTLQYAAGPYLQDADCTILELADGDVVTHHNPIGGNDRFGDSSGSDGRYSYVTFKLLK